MKLVRQWLNGTAHSKTQARRRYFRPSGEHLEDRLALSGVTVITHGAQPSFLNLFPFPKWPVAMGEAILDRADGSSTTRSTGSIYIHDQTSATWKPLAETGQTTTWNNSNAADEEIVLIYVWQAESITQLNGLAEAAADNLFASLFQSNTELGGTVENQRFIDLANRGNGELDLHFIGHSRGTIVNTLVAERFANYFPTWTIDQITSLDAHPAKIAINPLQSEATDPYYQANEANIRLPTFTNVSFADSYYRTDPQYQPTSTLDFSGVPVDGAHNVNLTPVLEAHVGNDGDNPLTSFDSNGFSLEHSDVHLWYHSTIQNTGPVSDGEITNFDPDAANWFQTLDRTKTGFAYSRIAVDTARPTITGKVPAQPLRTTIFNGDFLVGSDAGNTIPGWEYHGGSHDADLASGVVNLGNRTLFGIDREFIRHNLFYIPATADTLAFDYQVTRASTDDRLEVRIGSELVDLPPLIAVGSFRREVVIPDRFRDAANPLEFRIQTSTDIDVKFSLDNVALATGASVDYRVTSFDVEVEPLASGQTVSASFEVLNDGNRTSGMTTQWYLSRDSIITTADRPISTEEFIVLSAGESTGSRTKTLTLPKSRDPIWTGDGTYYIGMILDPENEITEVNEGNNANQGDGVDLDAVDVSGATGPVSIVTCGSGFVFSDLNGDDNFVAGADDGIPQATVNLLSASDRSVVASTQTADYGSYQFSNTAPGNFIVTVVRPSAFGLQTSPELAVTIVAEDNCGDANVDLGRLNPSYQSPRLFWASNRVGTPSRIALLKDILEHAEADFAQLNVNAVPTGVLETNSIESVATTSSSSALELVTPSGTVAVESVAVSTAGEVVSTAGEVDSTAGEVVSSDTQPTTPPVSSTVEAALPTVELVLGPLLVSQTSAPDVTAANSVSNIEAVSEEECELELVASIESQADKLSQNTSLIPESESTESSEVLIAEVVPNSDPDSRILIFGPDAPQRIESSDSDRRADVVDQLFAQIGSLFDDCPLYEEVL